MYSRLSALAWLHKNFYIDMATRRFNLQLRSFVGLVKCFDPSLPENKGICLGLYLRLVISIRINKIKIEAFTTIFFKSKVQRTSPKEGWISRWSVEKAFLLKGTALKSVMPKLVSVWSQLIWCCVKKYSRNKAPLYLAPLHWGCIGSLFSNQTNEIRELTCDEPMEQAQ